MMVVIAMLVGIYDIASLILIFALNATMILFGWLMELHNQTTRQTNWTAYWFGCFAGAVPWIAVAVYLAGDADPPGFVYGIFASLFVFFNVFAVNMLLQYKRVGRWRDYLYGERVYMLLSLVAKSLLAWQVFAGTLQPACASSKTSEATRRSSSTRRALPCWRSCSPSRSSSDSASPRPTTGGPAYRRSGRTRNPHHARPAPPNPDLARPRRHLGRALALPSTTELRGRPAEPTRRSVGA